MDIAWLQDSKDLLNDHAALKTRWNEDGVLYFRQVLDLKLINWAEQKFREALAGEDLIDPNVDDLVWSGNAPKTRRPCDAIGTEVWHKFAELPLLNQLAGVVLGDDPMWI